MPSYPPPVERLFTLGAEPAKRSLWPDYRHLGLTARHVAALLQVGTDASLRALPERDRARWAPVHAWRALALLGASEAAEPLLRVLERDVDDPWAVAELPIVLGMIGPAALPRATLLLFDEDRDERVRILASRVMVEVAGEFPERADEVASILFKQLEDWPHQTPLLNGCLIADLVELEAEDAVPVMEAAFAAGRVDLTVNGDWEDARIALGLLAARITPPTPWSPVFDDEEPVTGRVLPASNRQAAKTRSRRKAEKRARKRNRQRK